MKEENLSIPDISRFSLPLHRPPEFHGCGQFIADAGWIHSQRTIDTWELVLGLKGNIGLYTGGRSYILGPGDILLFPPGLEHGGTSPAQKGDSFYWAHFRPRAKSTGKDPAHAEMPGFLSRLGSCRTLAAMVHLQEASTDTFLAPALGDYLMGTLLMELHLASLKEQAKQSPELPWLNRLLAWDKVHPGAFLTVADMASFAGKHPDYLARVFREHLGTSPLEHIHAQRLELAKRALVESNLPIKQLAYDLSWPSLSQFSRFFRAHTAMGPREYRQTYSRIRYNRS